MSNHQQNQQRPQTSATTTTEATPTKPSKTAFLDKEVIDTMEDFLKFVSWSKRPGAEKKPCIVDADLYDIITEGDGRSPLFDYKNCQVIDASRKEEGLEMAGCKKQTHTVTL